MKTLKTYRLIALVLLLCACSADNDNDGVNFANATSREGCPNVTGPTAVYWDAANGIPAPFTSIPIMQGAKTRFTHSFPNINMSFDFPQGYTATEIAVPNSAFGVDLRRSNNNAQNKVFFRYYPVVSFNTTNIDQIRAFFINDLLANEYGFNGIPTLDCATPNQTVDFGGITRTVSNRAIRFGNTRAIISVAVVPTPLGSSASISISAGPINEYDSLVMNVFFPITFELLLPDRENLSDRDNDGVPDIFDIAPDNPNVS
ncbi:hypothetical protein [Tamlana crocina]|uniref:Lipoprotein n=1 Tax=Tamlana crocina TaxID=393006 RepID=A0ABX1D836_9FLAO|nr:hypothetical protein [Tamlana crocina]NJX14522.1 hypothetical protein [Tamlana crocina]